MGRFCPPLPVRPSKLHPNPTTVEWVLDVSDLPEWLRRRDNSDIRRKTIERGRGRLRRWAHELVEAGKSKICRVY
jgi:hypothetical protein